jgi:hypothetical protein
MYLNEVYLGNNLYGMGTAAQFYFHVPASRLRWPRGAARRIDPESLRLRPVTTPAPGVPAAQRCRQ